MDINHPENAEARLFMLEVRDGAESDIEKMAAKAKEQGRLDMLPMMRLAWREVHASEDPSFMDEAVCELRRWAASFVARADNFYATPTAAARGVANPPEDL